LHAVAIYVQCGVIAADGDRIGTASLGAGISGRRAFHLDGENRCARRRAFATTSTGPAVGGKFENIDPAAHDEAAGKAPIDAEVKLANRHEITASRYGSPRS
jgi:hypothetical protein